eukprot:TRINITY_DN10585_c0_g2_i2.p1 TRINITY_DN10585_c0_g2~~TRINITY_DN10585_c0_g2_i2.p1  ORF type:complete len:552 (+),score=112.48 TRINITY_DN10585_c0_g2_i2:30-1658(+)
MAVPFTALEIEDHPTGWGPQGEPSIFTGIPYQPFSKSDKLGKVASEFTGATNFRRDRYGNAYGGGDAFSYHHDDDSSFQLVDTSKVKQGFKGPKRWRNKRYVRTDPMRGVQQLSYNKNRERDRQRLERKLQKKWGQTAQRRFDRQVHKNLEASIDVKPSWELLEDIEFSKLAKLTMPVSEPVDYKKVGFVRFVDRATQDRIGPKSEVPLHKNWDNQWTPFSVTASDDPILRRMDDAGKAQVFATDDVLATLMCASRSFYSWDVLVTKQDGKLWFDKRDDGVIDYLTVDETAFQPPNDEGDSINAPHNLSREATFVDHAFRAQSLSKGKKRVMKSENPFPEEREQPVAYRYRTWDLAGVKLAARTTHDALMVNKDQSDEYISVKTFIEWNPQGTNLNWRSGLSQQRGAVRASQLKDNAFKLGRWVTSAKLASNTSVRVGYISRVNPQDSRRHSILKVDTFRTDKFAEQINLNVNNGWAVVRSLIALFMKQEDGQYIVLRDPKRTSIKVYRLPEQGLADDAVHEDESEQTTTISTGILSGSANI